MSSTAPTPSSILAHKWGFATPCLGFHENHTLERKFAAMQEAGWDHVELGFGNYVAWVRSRVPDLYVALLARAPADRADRPPPAPKSGR